MGIFSFGKKKDKLVLVFYVGSSSVEGALFHAQPSGIPKIIFSTREPIALEENIEAERFLSLTVKTLKIVVGNVHKAGFGAPKEIFCVLSSLWHVSQTRVIKLEKNMPFVFTSKLADGLIEKEKALFEEEHLQKYLNAGTPVRLIELKNIKTVLNGYETAHPLGQKGRELEMTIFFSMSGEEIIQKIEDIIKKSFHGVEIKFCSFTFSSFAVVRDMHMLSEDFLLITIGGELTDITMVKKNILRESISFPLGVNFLVRGVTNALSCSIGEAKSILSLLKDGHGEDFVTRRLTPVIEKLKKDWLTKFQESLSNLSNDISVPSTIYLAIDKDLASLFSETIKNEQFNQYTLTESKFEVIFLGTEVFHGLSKFEDNVIRDSFLIIDSIYINRLLVGSVSSDKVGNVVKL